MVMDVAFTPQREFYYHRSLSPSIHSFLAETPMGFDQTHWHRAGEKGSPGSMGKVGFKGNEPEMAVEEC